MKKYGLATVLITLCMSIQAQVTGFVYGENQKGKEQPLPQATVQIMNTTSAVFTDSIGYFSFATIPNHSNLIISYVGYISDTIHAHIGGRMTITLQVDNTIKKVSVVGNKATYKINHLDPKLTVNISENEIQRAACCNIGESFETNPNVDVSFTDAVTGTKQIKMLGLDGFYTQFTQELTPTIRGLNVANGLETIPASWVSSIQLIKGSGSVINGTESITGQINLELKKPDADEKVVADLFLAQSGRTEVDFGMRHQISRAVSTRWMVHGAIRPIEMDQNNDGFRDFPLSKTFSVLNRWKFADTGKWRGQIIAQHHQGQNLGGQLGFKGDYINQNNLSLNPSDDNQNNELNKFGFSQDHQTTSVRTKTAFVWKDKINQSIGFQTVFNRIYLNSAFGNYPTLNRFRNQYEGLQLNGYGNLIFQSQMKNPAHFYKLGASYLHDQYEENIDSLKLNRTEKTAGVFTEYTFIPSKRLSLVAGARVDHHNQYGLLFNPRLHVRYGLIKNVLAIRGLAGIGSRTSFIYAQNQALLASNRTFDLNQFQNAYQLPMERAVNAGFSTDLKFKMWLRPASFIVDYFHTHFIDQVVVDLYQSARTASIYHVKNGSRAHSLQAQLSLKPRKRVEVRGAYRYYDVSTDYVGGTNAKPLVASHRGFVTVSAQTRSLWSFDVTAHAIGKQPLPTTADNIIPYRQPDYSKAFTLLNIQTSKKFNDHFNAYLGVENVFNFRQDHAIVSADNPYSGYFDASMVWGPLFGRMIYGGIRYRFNKEKNEE